MAAYGIGITSKLSLFINYFQPLFDQQIKGHPGKNIIVLICDNFLKLIWNNS